MPIVSQAQRKFMFANHPKIAHEMAHNTPGFKKGALKHQPEHTTTAAERRKTANRSAPSGPKASAHAKSKSSSPSKGRSSAPSHTPAKSIHRSHAAGKSAARRARSK